MKYFSSLSQSSAGRFLRCAGSLFLDVLFPPRCPVCETILLPDEKLVCRRCAAKLPFVKEPYCMYCGKPLMRREKELCADCERHTHPFDEGRAVFLYEKGIRLSVNRLKFMNRREYIPFYGECLFARFLEMQPSWRAQVLVPVPMHPKKRSVRGFDQASLLARSLGGLCQLPVREDLLERTHLTKSSKKLGRTDRRKNLRGVFRVRPGAGIPESVILIDDIYTTGATMDEAAFSLRRAGVKRIFFLALCIGRGDA